MIRNMKRTIYDTLSVPVFLAVGGLFLFRIKKYIKLLAVETQASDGAKEEYLKQIAYTHVNNRSIIDFIIGITSISRKKS